MLTSALSDPPKVLPEYRWWQWFALVVRIFHLPSHFGIFLFGHLEVEDFGCASAFLQSSVLQMMFTVRSGRPLRSSPAQPLFKADSKIDQRAGSQDQEPLRHSNWLAAEGVRFMAGTYVKAS